MNLEDYKKKVSDTLQVPLTVDSPETLFKEAACIESLSYLAVKLSAIAEKNLTTLNNKLREEKAKLLPELKGTQMEKNIQLENSLKDLLEKVEQTELEMKYWKSIGKLIENKVSLAQSVLSNISSQVKAGMYFNNIK